MSNERIPFTPTMRMIFEIADMKHASPATVSRGGVVFINETDVGWKPIVESWRETLPDQMAQSEFYLLFSNVFEAVRPTFGKSVRTKKATLLEIVVFGVVVSFWLYRTSRCSASPLNSFAP